MSKKFYDIKWINESEFEIIGLKTAYSSNKESRFRLSGAVGLLNFNYDGKGTKRLMYVFREDNEPDDGYSTIEFMPLYDEDGNYVILKSDKLREVPFAIMNFNSHNDKESFRRIDDNATVYLYNK